MADDAPHDQREREYEQLRQDLMRRGRGPAEAEAIAERTVNRPRAASPDSAERASDDTPAPSARSQRSYRDLYAEAKSRRITGRSTMSKEELERRLAR